MLTLLHTHHCECLGLGPHEGLELPPLLEGPPCALDGHDLPLVTAVVRRGPRQQGAPVGGRYDIVV